MVAVEEENTTADLVFDTVATAESPTKLAVKAHGFSFVIDEPPSFGGEDAGPNPLEYLLASLAGCMNIVIHMVAKERGVTIDSVSIRTSGSIDPAKPMGNDTSERAGFKQMSMEFDIKADAFAEDIDSIVAEAKTRCPVSDNLGGATPIEFSIA